MALPRTIVESACEIASNRLLACHHFLGNGNRLFKHSVASVIGLNLFLVFPYFSETKALPKHHFLGMETVPTSKKSLLEAMFIILLLK